MDIMNAKLEIYSKYSDGLITESERDTLLYMLEEKEEETSVYESENEYESLLESFDDADTEEYDIFECALDMMIDVCMTEGFSDKIMEKNVKRSMKQLEILKNKQKTYEAKMAEALSKGKNMASKFYGKKADECKRKAESISLKLKKLRKTANSSNTLEESTDDILTDIIESTESGLLTEEECSILLDAYIDSIE